MSDKAPTTQPAQAESIVNSSTEACYVQRRTNNLLDVLVLIVVLFAVMTTCRIAIDTFKCSVYDAKNIDGRLDRLEKIVELDEVKANIDIAYSPIEPPAVYSIDEIMNVVGLCFVVFFVLFIGALWYKPILHSFVL